MINQNYVALGLGLLGGYLAKGRLTWILGAAAAYYFYSTSVEKAQRKQAGQAREKERAELSSAVRSMMTKNVSAPKAKVTEAPIVSYEEMDAVIKGGVPSMATAVIDPSFVNYDPNK